MSLLRRFLDVNDRLSARVRRHLESETDFFRRFDSLVVEEARSLEAGSIMVDLGGGKQSHFAHGNRRPHGPRLIAVDISTRELAENRDADETRVADVTDSLPFAEGEVDLLVSRTLLEHVDGVPAAVRNIAQVLRPGGTTLHLFPCRWSFFAMAARCLPFGFAKRIAHCLRPDLKGVVEFEVHYDHCEPRAMEALFREAGFRKVEVDVCWGQADYVRSVFPLYLLIGGYQELVRRLKLRRLAAYAVVRAVR